VIEPVVLADAPAPSGMLEVPAVSPPSAMNSNPTRTTIQAIYSYEGTREINTSSWAAPSPASGAFV